MTDRRVGPRISVAGAEQVPAVAQLVGRAFASLPPAVWLVPAVTERSRTLAAVFRIVVDHAVRHGTVEIITSDDAAADDPARRAPVVAAAVWFLDAHRAPPPPDYDARLAAAAAGDSVLRWQLLDRAMHLAHPATPHDYLALLAVDPAVQGRGLGSRLLDHHHSRLDEHDRPAYLEASSLDNVAFYRDRHGYQPAGKPFTVPGGPQPTMWPMHRPPASALSAEERAWRIVCSLSSVEPVA